MLKEERATAQQAVCGFERMLTLKDAKDVLGISYRLLLSDIRDGWLPAYKVTGRPISRDEIEDDTKGLRIKPEDLQTYLNNVRVR